MSKMLRCALAMCFVAASFVFCFAQVTGKKVVMVVAHDGFRDDEFYQPKEILERAGVQVKVASSSLDEAKGMLGGKVKPDLALSDVSSRDFDGIVFVGGIGASQYWDDPVAIKLAQEFASSAKLTSAICIAPVILANAGLLNGRRATAASSEVGQLKAAGAECVDMPVVTDGNIITADGPMSSGEFAEALVRKLTGQ